MKIWLITDTHIGHRNMINSCGRPENFSRLILKNWEKKVANTDKIIHLGDIAWGDDNLKKVMRMPGHKILIRGNHDPKSLENYMEEGFDFACDELGMTIEGVKILFTHRPRVGHMADVNIHGHEHDVHRVSETEFLLPISLEVMGYEPIAMDHEFIRTLRSWSDKFKAYGTLPTLDEIRLLGPNPIPKLRERDFIGRGHEEE